MVRNGGLNGRTICAKLDLSGIMNMQTIISGYYAPLEISIYLDDAAVCMEPGTHTLNAIPTQYKIHQPRLCIDELVLTPSYLSAFESALVERSSSNGVQMSFDTYSVFSNTINCSSTGAQTFWLRQPVRYLRGVY